MDYNLNGFIIRNKHLGIQISNRGLNYGDGVFETLKFANNRINFWEDHYFRLMASMRIVRMDIPMDFSPEYLEDQIRKTLDVNGLSNKAARVKLLVVRKAGGLYTPETNAVDFLITTEELSSPSFQLNEKGLNIDLYKDFYKNSGMLSTIKTTSAQLYTVASIFRKENNYDECLLLNERKEVVEAISANIFIVKGDDLITPPLESGCLKGIMRKKIIEFATQLNFNVKEESFSPFALQKADEVWLSNSIKGLQWVGQYRKKSYRQERAAEMLKKININIALNLG
jgi:branched-chain amino acid aminotransferase